MSVWTYGDLDLNSAPESICKVGVQAVQNCIYCDNGLTLLTDAKNRLEAVHTCSRCGWWLVSRDATTLEMHPEDERPKDIRHTRFRYRFARAWGTLKNLDLSDASLPMDELKQALLAKYDDRGKVDPFKFEQLVGDVFSNTGYSVRVTSCSGDDGLDGIAVLDGDDDVTIGIQVKRYGGKIGAEQIRAFAGALFLADQWDGIYVTTSSFTRGAKKTTDRYAKRGIKIKLVDADRFYDRLELSQRPAYDGLDDPDGPWHPFVNREREMPSLWEGWGPD